MDDLVKESFTLPNSFKMSEKGDDLSKPYTSIPWTESGYPAVDGKYINLETGTLETTTPDM